MTKGDWLTSGCLSKGRRRLALPLVLGCVGLGYAGGCDSLNPAFVGLIDPSGASTTIPNASGHVVIQFVNNAEVDERLVQDLEGRAGLVLTGAEKRALRPRVRFRVLVSYANGTASTFEIVDGSTKLIDPAFAALADADLNQNDLNNAVVVCDRGVTSVQVLTQSFVEIYIPVELVEFTQREITSATGQTTIEFVESQRFPPDFRALQADLVDADNNVILRQNIGIRDVPAPALDPVCGTVIAIVMDGVLSVPFLPQGGGLPSYDVTDIPSVAGIGGRFEFRTVKLEN